MIVEGKKDADGRRRLRCTVCGTETAPCLAEPRQFVHQCATPLDRTACIHRGDELRQVGCATCQGSVRVKVFVCEAHGECSIGKPLDGMACCATCEEFEAG